MNSIRIIVLLYLFSAIHAFAAIGNDKTLQVDFFGTSLLHIDENSDGIFEREDALLQYAQDNGITVLILRKLELAKIPGVKYILPSDSVYVNSRDTTLENHLGRFIHKARTQYGISKVCSSANPYWKTGTGSSSVYNQNNRHFGNINEFNRRQKALNDSTYCFNMVMVEHDFWLGSNPLTNIFKNWDTLYLPGLRYLYNIVKTTSNTPLYHSLTVATYIGNLKPVEAAVLATPDSISQQQQVDSIDKYTDWVYIDFYFRGDKIDQKNTAGIYQFFARDKSLGSRMLRFAQNSYPSYILPLYACQSSADVNSNFFGDYIVNKNGMYFSQDSTAWHGTLDDVKTIFESLYNDTIDPYGTGSTFTLKQLCENNATVPNNMSVGVAWFKYSTMPESGYMLKSADTTGSAVATTFTIRPDELIKTGSNGCSNCDSINASKNEVAGQIISRIWYLNGDSIANEHNDTLMANLLLGDTSIYTYEFTVYDPGNTGAFNKLKIRKDTKIVKPLIIGNDCGWGPHWNVNASTNSSCPSYSNGTVSLEYICSSCSNINMIYKWYDSNNNLLLTQNSATTTATGLSAGKYQVKFYCSSNNFVSECFVMVYAVDNSPHPTIYSDNDEINCYASMHINSAYSSYSIQWYRNGTGAGNAISGATGLSYTAIQNGTYYVKVTQSGGCSGFSAPLVINYSPNATISGSDITCEINKTYSVAENPNNATYDWTLPGGVSASADGYSTITISNWNSAASTGGTISCTITNVCGNSTTANFVVKGCCDVGTGDLNNATLSTTQTLSGSFHINGTLNISGSGTVVTMSSADVQLNKEAKINVGAGAKLIITGGSYLRTCGSDMWTGIELLASSAEVQLLSKSKIEDAIVAIDAPHNGKVVIDDATLNANYIGLKITGTGVANSSYIGSSAIFSCKNSSNVNANCLKSPHSSQRTLQGICLNGIGSISIGDASNSSNEISNCETGIYTSTSTVNVTKTDFEVCNIGINAQNDAALNVTSSNFDECVTGIDDRYNVDLNVSSCNFNTGTKGIYTSLGNTISIGIHDNNFTDFTAFAIQHISNHRVQYSIYNNIISNTGSEGMNYPGGIEINGLYDNSIDNNSVTDIYLNEFYNLAKGIHLQSIDYAP
ncbi:MAG: hypothetical protein IPN99_13900 [Bacteroidetes bacterium]|nr:hypothetical protein [Bacteroidota bacterium]